jgi:hypothetical protein
MGRYATGVINVRHAWHATGRPPSTAQFETKSLSKSDWDQTHFSWQTQNLSLSLPKSDWDWPYILPTFCNFVDRWVRDLHRYVLHLRVGEAPIVAHSSSCRRSSSHRRGPGSKPKASSRQSVGSERLQTSSARRVTSSRSSGAKHSPNLPRTMTPYPPQASCSAPLSAH